MGNSASAQAKAKELAGDDLTEIQNLIAILEAKANEFVARTKLERAGAESLTEVSGGRTVSRMTQIRVSDGNGVDPQITTAIGDFFEAAQGGDAGKQAAVDGAKNLIFAGIDAIFGASKGQGIEKKGFVVLFLNYAFVRVDYLVYSYNATGTVWGMKSTTAGACYVCDLAVLDTATDLKHSEIDYLISQSLSIPPSKDTKGKSVFETIMELKIMLTESAILSRMLNKPDLTFDELGEATDNLTKVNLKIKDAFEDLPTAVKKPGSDNPPSTPPKKK